MLRGAFLAVLLAAVPVMHPVALAEGTGTVEQQSVTRLATALRLEETIAILRDEGLANAAELDRQMLRGEGGAAWQVQVGLIYDQERMVRILSDALASGLAPSHRAAVIAYFETDPGKRILQLENEARELIADPDTESLAVATFQDRAGSDDPRAKAILRFIDINDLVTRNVEGALNAEYQFLRGLAEGRGEAADDDDILADVWDGARDSEESIRTWITAYLHLAYQPISDADLESYIRFSETGAGQELNRVLFEGFDVLYRNLSYALGEAVAQSLQSSDI